MFKTGWRAETEDHFYVELKLKLQTANAQEHADNFSALWEKFSKFMEHI